METAPYDYISKLGDFSGIEVRDIGKPIGKGLFATQAYSEGDIIFEENPLVACQFSWNRACKYLACDHCLRPLETLNENVTRLTKDTQISLPYADQFNQPIPRYSCPICEMRYCSEACRNAAFSQYHDILCTGTPEQHATHPLTALEDIWKNMHYPPETTTAMLLARMFAMVKKSNDKSVILNIFSKFCQQSRNEEEFIVHKMLVSEEFVNQLSTLRRIFEQCFPFEETKQWLTPSGFTSLMAMIGTNGQGIGSSIISKWVCHCDELDLPAKEREEIDNFIDNLYEKLDQESGCFLNVEGSGLYSMQSACNHSCSPNAEVTFPHNNATLTLKALKNIEVGDEICISYLDECSLERSRHSRHKVLKENYLFICHCLKCESQINDDDVTSEEEMSDDDDDESS